MNKKIWILIIVVVVSSFSLLADEFGYDDPYLPKLAKDLYCKMGGDCSFNNLKVENLSVTGAYVNVTVTDFNVTRNIAVQGNVSAANFFGNLYGTWNESGNYALCQNSSNITCSAGIITTNVSIPVSSGGADSLGNHTASMTLNMTNHSIINIRYLNFTANASGYRPYIYVDRYNTINMVTV